MARVTAEALNRCRVGCPQPTNSRGDTRRYIRTEQVLVGSTDPGTGADFALLRVNPDGTPDANFAVGSGLGGAGRQAVFFGDTPGSSLPLSSFFLVDKSSTVQQINLALALGDNLMFTPGVNQVPQSMTVFCRSVLSAPAESTPTTRSPACAAGVW